MKNLFKTLTGLIYSAVFLLLIGAWVCWKVYFWDSEVLKIDYKEEVAFACGVTDDMYPPAFRLNLSGKYLNQTGESLFKNNCAACHAIQETVVGPALANITERRNSEWIHNFITNSSAMVKQGDTAAINIFNEYGRQQMPSFALTSAEVDSIIAYIAVFSGAISDIPYPVE